jgi:hypothetical protein
MALDWHPDWDDLLRSYRLLNAVLHGLHLFLADSEAETISPPVRRTAAKRLDAWGCDSFTVQLIDIKRLSSLGA